MPPRSPRQGRSAASASATVAPSSQLDLDRLGAGALAQDRKQTHLIASTAADATPRQQLDRHPLAGRAAPGPASTTARASAPSIEVRTWEPWGPVGVASQPPSASSSEQRTAWSRSGRRGDVGRELRRRHGGSSGAPGSASSAGRTKRMKVTNAETGLPGRPKTSVASPGDAEPGRACRGAAPLPRTPARHRASASAGCDVVVLADRHASADDRDVGLQGRASAFRGGLAVVARSARRRRPRRRPAGQRRARCRRSSCGPRRVASARPAASSSSPVQTSARRGRRAHAGSETPSEARTPSSAAPSMRPGVEHDRLGRADVLAGAADVPPGSDRCLEHDPAVALDRRVLDAHDRVGPFGQHRRR